MTLQSGQYYWKYRLFGIFRPFWSKNDLFGENFGTKINFSGKNYFSSKNVYWVEKTLSVGKISKKNFFSEKYFFAVKFPLLWILKGPGGSVYSGI